MHKDRRDRISFRCIEKVADKDCTQIPGYDILVEIVVDQMKVVVVGKGTIGTINFARKLVIGGREGVFPYLNGVRRRAGAVEKIGLTI